MFSFASSSPAPSSSEGTLCLFSRRDRNLTFPCFTSLSFTCFASYIVFSLQFSSIHRRHHIIDIPSKSRGPVKISGMNLWVRFSLWTFQTPFNWSCNFHFKKCLYVFLLILSIIEFVGKSLSVKRPQSLLTQSLTDTTSFITKSLRKLPSVICLFANFFAPRFLTFVKKEKKILREKSVWFLSLPKEFSLQVGMKGICSQVILSCKTAEKHSRKGKLYWISREKQNNCGNQRRTGPHK